MQRSKLAEIFAAKFAALPLVAECVFLNPAFLDGTLKREVCDLLLVLRNQAAVVQMKSQDKERTDEKLNRWIGKETKNAASQSRAPSEPFASARFGASIRGEVTSSLRQDT